MTIPRKSHSALVYPEGGFDVTGVIGHVEFNSTGEHTPVEAAMLIIARHGAPGRFTFPHENGGFHHVTVEFEIPEDRDSGYDF